MTHGHTRWQNSMTNVYNSLLRELTYNFDHESRLVGKNERTGQRVATAWGARSFSLDLSDRLLPVVGTRRLRPSKAAAEAAWFLSGTADATWINERARHWRDFCETDAETGVQFVEAAYGARMRGFASNDFCLAWHNQDGSLHSVFYPYFGFDRDQWKMACDRLRSHATDRQCYVSYWDPRSDGLGHKGAARKSSPCPLGFHAHVVGGALHWTVTLRSSDVFMGLPYDVMGHAIMQAVMATEVGVELGTLSFCLSNAHLYEVHLDEARRCVHDWQHGLAIESRVPLPAVTTEDVLLDRDAFVSRYAEASKQARWPTFDPTAEIVL